MPLPHPLDFEVERGVVFVVVAKIAALMRYAGDFATHVPWDLWIVAFVPALAGAVDRIAADIADGEITQPGRARLRHFGVVEFFAVAGG